MIYKTNSFHSQRPERGRDPQKMMDYQGKVDKSTTRRGLILDTATTPLPNAFRTAADRPTLSPRQLLKRFRSKEASV